jgi:hypothetical protein
MKFNFAAWACLYPILFMGTAFGNKVAAIFALLTLVSPVVSLVSIQILLANWKTRNLSETPARIFLGLLFFLGGVMAALNLDAGMLSSRLWLTVPCSVIAACLAYWVASKIMRGLVRRHYEVYFVMHAAIIFLTPILLFTSQE